MLGLNKIKFKRQPKNLILDYDQRHDILYVSIGNPVPSYSNEEKLKGVYVRKAIGTEKITGATVMDYSKRDKQTLGKYIPFKVDFHNVRIC